MEFDKFKIFIKKNKFNAIKVHSSNFKFQNNIIFYNIQHKVFNITKQIYKQIQNV